MKSSIETHDAPASSLTTVTAAPLGAYLSNAMLRRGEPLLHQQCWCWGCDIRRAEGNLLLEYGFEKHRPPDDAEGSSAYRLDLSCFAPSLSAPALDVSHVEKRVRSVVLWGFGFFYADSRLGGIFIQRYKFTPKLTRAIELPMPLWKAAQLPAHDIPRTRHARQRALRLLVGACTFIEAYERWVLGVVGLAYRRRCLAEFKHTIHTPEETIAEWRRLREACAAMSDGEDDRDSGADAMNVG